MSTTTKPQLTAIAVSPGDAAALLGVSVKTLANWRSLGTGPSYVRLGGRIGYRPADLEKFANQGLVKTA